MIIHFFISNPISERQIGKYSWGNFEPNFLENGVAYKQEILNKSLINRNQCYKPTIDF